MARKRVIAHFMHESEAADVIPFLSDSQVTEGFAIGEIDEADMAELERRGIIFQELGAETRGPLVAPEAEERVMATEMEQASSQLRSSEGASNTYYLTLTGPLLAEWRQRLEAFGVAFRAALPDQRWVIKIDPAQLANLWALPFVADLEMRGGERNLPTKQEVSLQSTQAAQDQAPASQPYDVLLDRDAPLGEFLAWLRERNIPVAAAEGNKVRLYLPENDPHLIQIAALTDWVIDITPYIEPELHNNYARILLGVESPPSASPAFQFPFEGETEIIGVADTGLDDNHPDFANRIAGLSALGRPGDTSDPAGHGTHVAGSILGDGSASQGAVKGVAPKARLFFQSLLDKDGRLGGLPFRLSTLFAEAYAAGARIHNNSWGARAMASYQVNSREVDEYVYSQKDMLIVISAGNEGTAADPPLGLRNSQTGFVDWLSVCSPATAKNALTVGASRSNRTTGGFSTLTYGLIWPAKFPADPSAADPVSGDDQSIAGFSSRGPCDDYRIKPDLVAPGTDILSCLSAQAPLHHFWGPDPNHPRYAYMGGTSMSAPLVAGCAALVRQYYTQVRNHSPSAALLKATLINSTRLLNGASAVADFSQLPNYHQGYGAVYLPLAVPNPHGPNFELDFYDNWQTPASYFTVTGGRRRFSFDLHGGGELRITMAYTDPPGRALQNNLNLFLQLPDGSKQYGNMRLPNSLNRPDGTNNVEVIRLGNAPAGNYLIQVVATNLLEPQDFALVVTGDFSTRMVEV